MSPVTGEPGTTFASLESTGALSYAIDPDSEFANKKISTEVVCTADAVRMPVRVGENRSRTWIYTKHADKLELRHDHRTKDGHNDSVTMYGGFSYGEGTAIRQEFQSLERTTESGYFRGWRIEIEPGVRYTYGTVRGNDWSWRIDFDLSQPLTELPPAPWGHE